VLVRSRRFASSPETVYVGPRLRPIAVIHAQVTSEYLFWIPIPGHVDLDYVP